MAAIIRLKRKASEEPAEGLVIALKKPKCDVSDTDEVLFKFAATLNSEKESVRDHIQAALSKEKTEKFTKWRDPKNKSIEQRSIENLCKKLKAEHKSANEKKKLDYLNNRRLILAEEFQDLDNHFSKDAEVRQLFHLYDIIEENEDVKKQNEEVDSSIITCNDEPLIREKVDDYVFDVYIADRHIDRTFIDGTVSVRPCNLTIDDIYSGESDDSEECYDDEDDSNDENNWRNEYPEDDTHSDRSSSNEDSDDDSCSVGCDANDYQDDVLNAFHEVVIGGNDDGYDDFDLDLDDSGDLNFDYSAILQELKDEYDEGH